MSLAQDVLHNIFCLITFFIFWQSYNVLCIATKSNRNTNIGFRMSVICTTNTFLRSSRLLTYSGNSLSRKDTGQGLCWSTRVTVATLQPSRPALRTLPSYCHLILIPFRSVSPGAFDGKTEFARFSTESWRGKEKSSSSLSSSSLSVVGPAE